MLQIATDFNLFELFYCTEYLTLIDITDKFILNKYLTAKVLRVILTTKYHQVFLKALKVFNLVSFVKS
jgi:hypothetical protein